MSALNFNVKPHETHTSFNVASYIMLSENLHQLFFNYILSGRIRAPPESMLDELKPTFQPGAHINRRALQAKFKSWARRMRIDNENLFLENSNKMIIPAEQCPLVIMNLHSEQHLPIEEVVRLVKDKYTWTRKNFGMDWDTVATTIMSCCENENCRANMQQKMNNEGAASLSSLCAWIPKYPLSTSLEGASSSHGDKINAFNAAAAPKKPKKRKKIFTSYLKKKSTEVTTVTNFFSEMKLDLKENHASNFLVNYEPESQFNQPCVPFNETPPQLSDCNPTFTMNDFRELLQELSDADCSSLNRKDVRLFANLDLIPTPVAHLLDNNRKQKQKALKKGQYSFKLNREHLIYFKKTLSKNDESTDDIRQSDERLNVGEFNTYFFNCGKKSPLPAVKVKPAPPVIELSEDSSSEDENISSYEGKSKYFAKRSKWGPPTESGVKESYISTVSSQPSVYPKGQVYGNDPNNGENEQYRKLPAILDDAKSNACVPSVSHGENLIISKPPVLHNLLPKNNLIVASISNNSPFSLCMIKPIEVSRFAPLKQNASSVKRLSNSASSGALSGQKLWRPDPEVMGPGPKVKPADVPNSKNSNQPHVILLAPLCKSAKAPSLNLAKKSSMAETRTIHSVSTPKIISKILPDKFKRNFPPKKNTFIKSKSVIIPRKIFPSGPLAVNAFRKPNSDGIKPETKKNQPNIICKTVSSEVGKQALLVPQISPQIEKMRNAADTQKLKELQQKCTENKHIVWATKMKHLSKIIGYMKTNLTKNVHKEGLIKCSERLVNQIDVALMLVRSAKIALTELENVQNSKIKDINK